MASRTSRTVSCYGVAYSAVDVAFGANIGAALVVEIATCDVAGVNCE